MPDLLGHGNLDVINGVMVPVGGENGVGKTQGQQVHYRFLTEIMVNAVHLILGKYPGHGIIYFLGGLPDLGRWVFPAPPWFLV